VGVFNSQPQFLKLANSMMVALGVRYFLFAGLAWILGYVLFRQRWFHRKIIRAFPATSEVRREMVWSASSVVIFSCVGALTILAGRHGWTQMYWKLSDHGAAWFVGSIVGAILVHDTLFYWCHRWMHQPRWFRWVHRLHHESDNPTPWAAYSFSPPEAVIQALVFPVVALLIPIHPYAFGLFMLWQITFNVLGHTGYEFHPRWLMDSRWGRYLNTPTNHVLHHERIRGNYGLYFNVWDRWMGTNHPDYENRFREVTGRPRAGGEGVR
jgi:hypothetical protein